jgi:hypothetical protein
MLSGAAKSLLGDGGDDGDVAMQLVQGEAVLHTSILSIILNGEGARISQ